jgi:hypothetical protein
MIRPVQTTRPRSVNTAASAMVRGRRVVRNDPDIGPITRERRGSARCPRCGPRKKPELRGIPWCGIDNPGVVPTPEIQPGEAGRAEIVERSESAGDQGGPMFGRCLIASRARLPSAGSSSFVAGSDRADHRCRASGIRRLEASRGDCQGGAHTPIYQRTRFRVPSSWCTNPSALASPSDGDAKELPFSGDTS